MSSRIPLAVPNIGDAERRLVAEAMASGFVSSVGPFVTQFEEEFAAYVGAKHAVACSTGTAALQVAHRVCGIEAGHEVACSDFTFIASANAAVYLGANLTLVDSGSDSWGMDTQLLRKELERRTATGEALPAIVELVHILGEPADAAGVRDLCEEYGMVLVEDAAEALGATWSGAPLAGKHVGTIGRVGCYSFNGNKIMTTGGGGMLVTDDDELAVHAKHLTTQARVPDRGYLHDEVGYNYRLTNVAAAIGLAQLRRMPEFVSSKREIAARYDAALVGTNFGLLPSRSGVEPTRWLYCVLVSPDHDGTTDRDDLLDFLSENGIESRALWRPLHDQPALAGTPVLGGRVGEDLFRRGLSIPCSTQLTGQEQDRVIECLLAWDSRHR